MRQSLTPAHYLIFPRTPTTFEPLHTLDIHFLIGHTISLPSPDVTNTSINRLSSWQHIQYVKQHFWKRWYKECRNQLYVRSKWQSRAPGQIKIGTMVLLKEDNTPPLRWPSGRICEVFPGVDGKVRVISVKTISGT